MGGGGGGDEVSGGEMGITVNSQIEQCEEGCGSI